MPFSFFNFFKKSIAFYTVLVYTSIVRDTILKKWGEKLNAQFKKGVVELCILKLLSKKDMYGFEVINALANLLFVNENTIYPILRRLTQQGLFTTYTKETNLGAPRKYYRLTEKGRKQLDSYLQEWNLFFENVNLILGGKYEEE